MGTVKFNDGNFYLNGEYIGSGKFTSATETIRQKDARIKFLEEQLIHERARSEKFLHILNEYESVFKTPAEMKDYIDKTAEFSVKMAKLKQEAITIDMVEKAAYDIIRCFVKEEDCNRPTPWAIKSNDALVTLITTRLVERVKQYAKD